MDAQRSEESGERPAQGARRRRRWPLGLEEVFYPAAVAFDDEPSDAGDRFAYALQRRCGRRIRSMAEVWRASVDLDTRPSVLIRDALLGATYCVGEVD